MIARAEALGPHLTGNGAIRKPLQQQSVQRLAERREPLPPLARKHLWVKLALVPRILARRPDVHEIGGDGEVDDGYCVRTCLLMQYGVHMLRSDATRAIERAQNSLPMSNMVMNTMAKTPSVSNQ